MKPIFIYENENCPTITISRERFEKLINEAYECGKKDAHNPNSATNVRSDETTPRLPPNVKSGSTRSV